MGVISRAGSNPATPTSQMAVSRRSVQTGGETATSTVSPCLFQFVSGSSPKSPQVRQVSRQVFSGRELSKPGGNRPVPGGTVWLHDWDSIRTPVRIVRWSRILPCQTVCSGGYDEHPWPQRSLRLRLPPSRVRLAAPSPSANSSHGVGSGVTCSVKLPPLPTSDGSYGNPIPSLARVSEKSST